MKTNLDAIAKDVSGIQMNYLENHGFLPDAKFLFTLYIQGELILTDSQENSLKMWFEISGIELH
jgi:hypothetical protein